MNRANGFIVLHRKMLEWEWHTDPNTLSLFVHLLLGANHEDNRFRGREIKRGQLVTSITELSTNTGLSFQQTRTALEHLISTGEITNETSPQGSVISIVNYDKYQDKQQTNQQTSNKRSTSKSTNDQQTDQQTNQQLYNNINNINNENKETMKQESRTASRFTPPSLDEVRAYCQERGNNVDPEKWLDHYNSNGWKVGKNSMKDWRAAVRTWEKRETEFVQTKQKQNPAAQFTQRDYSSADDMALSDMLDILMGSQYGGSGA